MFVVRSGFIGPDGGNPEGAYWRYEMRVREMESELAGVTAGNGAIYAVRQCHPLAPPGSHDPFVRSPCWRRFRLSLPAPGPRDREAGPQPRRRTGPQAAG